MKPTEIINVKARQKLIKHPEKMDMAKCFTIVAENILSLHQLRASNMFQEQLS